MLFRSSMARATDHPASAGGPRAKAGWSVALAMEWNGTEITKPETFLVKTGAAGVGK